jgi:type III secretion protein U
MNDSTEERALPATKKKLDEARKKGQIFHSSDMVAAATTCSVLLLVWLSTKDLLHEVRMTIAGFGETSVLPFRQATMVIAGSLSDAVVPFLIRLTITVVSVSILTNLVISRGFLFSLEPMKPRADHLNPVEGFKRMFAVRGLIELVKSLLKTLLLIAFCIGIGLGSVNAILRAPSCGWICLSPLFTAAIRPLVLAGTIVLLSAGLIDILVQRWLFQRQMRMTRTELKRERKDQEGTPEIRTAQRRGRRELLQGAAGVGVEAAPLFIAGEDVTVGLRYVRGETPVPRLVCKGRGIRARHLLMLRASVPKVDDAELAADLDRRIEPGHYIAEEFYNPVARALHEAAGQAT